jgi:hypothetical protein
VADHVSANPYPPYRPSVRPLNELVRLSPLLLALASLAPVLPASTASPGVAAGLGAEAEPDTILRRDLSIAPATVRSGVVAAADEPHVRLGLKRIPVYEDRLGLRASRALPGRVIPTPSSTAGATVPPLFDLIQLSRMIALGWNAADSALFLPAPAELVGRLVEAPAGQEAVPRFQSEYADLALNVTSRMEVGGEWARFQPCDEQFKVSCTPNLIPQLSPDLQFGVQVDGTIADRIQVDVDFDQSREFDASNRINMFYEGREDDILQRLEVGDVDFRLPTNSRFLTEGIPAGNFGFQAAGQLGPLEFQSVWAQQKGDLNTRQFRLTGLGDQRGFVQEDTLVLDDADYVRGQFFFLVDPSEIDDYPHVDALALDPASAPPSVVPGVDPIQLYRFQDEPVFQQQVEGFIQADAVAEGEGGTVIESGWFRYLQPGLDYSVHPSGLWVSLRAPLGRDEMLAVTYVTAVGDTVGDYNPERLHNAGERPTLKLLRASGANHQPGRATWDQEMHQVYRVSGSPDVEHSSVELTISLGELSAGRTFKRGPTGEDVTFLRLFGLDEESPVDVLDPSFVYSPGAEFFQEQPPVQGTFVVFPTLRPFAAPPELRASGLTDIETGRILGEDANGRIYEEEDPFERDNAGRFRLTMAYRLRSEGVISSFSLGAFGIRDGSERVFLGDRVLTRGVDYEIDYDVGQVRLLEPEQLFSSNPDAPVRATWEQRALFQVSPTQVFGLSTHADLGAGGGIDVLGLYRSERSVVNRPILGTEPGAALLGGASGSYQTGAQWIDRLLDRLPGLSRDGETSVSVNGEFAVSLPNPNTAGQAFLDDFDSRAQLPVSLLSSNWSLASAPTMRDGARLILPGALDASTAAPLVWQHSWVDESVVGDSVGVREGFYPRLDIDRQIRVAGAEVREPAMILSFGGATLQGPGWRSITTSLSTNGLDLTKTEFVEFYASGAEELTLVIDLGTVSEDAFFVDSLGNTSGTRAETGERWGLGLLDQEADPRLGELWNDAADSRGVWGETCESERGRIYRLGDPRAPCTRGNGRQDTEDLDRDGNLDVRERHLRYVVRLDGNSPFLARTKAETETEFQLYRIPVRGVDAVEVGGAFSDADLRAVRHMRLTLTGSNNRRLQIARMRLVGSRWIKRAGEGVLSGIVGDTLAGFGRMEVASVSRVTEGDEYASPPGVLEELVNPTSAFSGEGIEFNEKSLGLRFEDVPAHGRAEVYHRFAQRPRNFLAYRQARLWVVPREGDFGPDEPHYFFFKVGNDAENFYLFRTPLQPVVSPGGVASPDWLPQIVIDFDEWFDLRRQAEEELLLQPRGPGDPPVTVWAPDSTYAVVLKDRGRAPNLAAVREMSIGVWNEGMLPMTGEIWVDELRLGRSVRDAGLATSLDFEIDGAGVLTTRASVTSRGAFFRQLRDDPSYQDNRMINVNSRLALDRWMPADWGIDLPVTLDYDRATQAPRFLANSDIRADRLQGLRSTDSRQTRVGLSFRKRTQSADPWMRLLVDGLDARLAYSSIAGASVTTQHDADAVDAGFSWARDPTARDFGIVPGFATGAVRALLPGFLEDKVLGSRIRWNPERVSIGTSYSKIDSRIQRFDRIIEHADDSLALVTRAPREALQTAADIRFRPLPPLSAALTITTVRDILPPEDAVTDDGVRALIREERTRAAGLDLGWETDRSLRTRVSFGPSVFSWLRSDFNWSTVYRADRNANLLNRQTLDGDTTLALARNASGRRDWRANFSLDPTRMVESWLGPGTGDEPADMAEFRSLIGALRPLTLTYQDGIVSRFNRDPIDPGLGYQLGFGGPEGFRLIQGDTAATLTDRSAWTLGSGVVLPGGFGIDAGFQQSEGTTLDTRSDRRTVLKRWPDVRARLPALTLPAATKIRSVSLSSGVTRIERETEFGGRGVQRRFDEDVQVPLNVSIAWLGTLVTSYRGAFREGRGVDPTGDTERDRREHHITVSSMFVPPGGLASHLDRAVRLSLIAGYTSERECRTTTARNECVAFLDQILRSVNLSLDTSVSGFELGAQVSYDDRQSFVGQRTGSTQFQMMLWGQLQFSAGTIPLRPGRF